MTFLAYAIVFPFHFHVIVKSFGVSSALCGFCLSAQGSKQAINQLTNQPIEQSIRTDAPTVFTSSQCPTLPRKERHHPCSKVDAQEPLPFRLPILTISPSPARLFHSSVSRLTLSRYVLASSLPSTSSCGQCPERRRCRLRFSQRQSGLKVQPGWGQR